MTHLKFDNQTPKITEEHELRQVVLSPFYGHQTSVSTLFKIQCISVLFGVKFLVKINKDITGDTIMNSQGR